MKKLFSPIKIGKHMVKNRIMMPAMGTSFCNSDGTVSPTLCNYVEQRAKGGVGLIVLEITSVAFPEGAMSLLQLQLTDDYTIPGFRELADMVHPYGTKIIAQLHHAGLKSPVESSRGREIVSCVDMDINGKKVRGLTKEEISELVKRFGEAALRAKRSGLDGVEIHAGHGYLVSQFLSKKTNKRDDCYGGDVEGRTKFLVEIIRKIREVCGYEFLLSIRLGALDFIDDGNKIEDGIEIAKILDKEGIDLLSLTTGIRFMENDNVETQEKPDGNRLFLAETIKPYVKVPVAIVGKIRTAKMCEDILESNITDMVCIGRQLICDPFWPKKILEGKENEIRQCLNCSEGCFGNLVKNSSGIRCAINPYVGLEGKYDENNLPLANTKKRVVVVGGGVAGMQAAIVAAERGHEVVLLEKENELGGQIRIASVPDNKSILNTTIEYFHTELIRRKVEVKLGICADTKYIKTFQPDHVVIATGSLPSMPPIKGIEQTISAWSLLESHNQLPEGEEIVVIGGGTVGCEIAIMLAQLDNNVTILEMTSKISNGQEYTHRARDMKLISALDVTVITNASVLSVDETGVTFKEHDNKDVTIAATLVVASTGQRSRGMSLCNELVEEGISTSLAGDSQNIGNIRSNVRSGFFAGYQI